MDVASFQVLLLYVTMGHLDAGYLTWWCWAHLGPQGQSTGQLKIISPMPTRWHWAHFWSTQCSLAELPISNRALQYLAANITIIFLICVWVHDNGISFCWFWDIYTYFFLLVSKYLYNHMNTVSKYNDNKMTPLPEYRSFRKLYHHQFKYSWLHCPQGIAEPDLQ